MGEVAAASQGREDEGAPVAKSACKTSRCQGRGEESVSRSSGPAVAQDALCAALDSRFLADLNRETSEKYDLHFAPLVAGWYNEERRRVADASARAVSSSDGAAPTQLLEDCSEDTVCLVGYSGAEFLEKLVLPHFAEFRASIRRKAFVDSAVDFAMGEVKRFLEARCGSVGTDCVTPPLPDSSHAHVAGDLIVAPAEAARKDCESNEVIVRNLDAPPYLHAQTLGFAAGVACHVEESDLGPGKGLDTETKEAIAAARDPRIWGPNNSTVHGVSLHPQLGGWFAYRMLVVLPGWRWAARPGGAVGAALCPAAPRWRLPPEEAAFVIEEFNLRPNVCRWRDVLPRSSSVFGPVSTVAEVAEDAVRVSGNEGDARVSKAAKQYSAQAYLFFHEQDMEKRARFLELAASRGVPPLERMIS
eukprot:gene105-13_t